MDGRQKIFPAAVYAADPKFLQEQTCLGRVKPSSYISDISRKGLADKRKDLIRSISADHVEYGFFSSRMMLNPRVGFEHKSIYNQDFAASRNQAFNVVPWENGQFSSHGVHVGLQLNRVHGSKASKLAVRMGCKSQEGSWP